MKHEFWHDKWQKNQLGFHQLTTHPLLAAYLGNLGLSEGETVFVPFCGKSRDMMWLQQCGYKVIGVELSEIAVQSFFDENGLTCITEQDPPFIHFQSEGIELFCGDFLSMDKASMTTVNAVFDRAALVALPEQMRPAYVDKLQAMLTPGALLLLITVEYEAGEINPPPFAVTRKEVELLYRDWRDIEVLGRGEAKLKNVSCFEIAYLISA